MSSTLPSLAMDERLGRGIFDSQHKKRAERGNIPFKIFLLKAKEIDISVDRLNRGENSVMCQIGDDNAKSRGANRRFYGWAVILVEKANQNGRLVIHDPILDNPYHALIKLPSLSKEEVRDNQQQHAKELAVDSQWRSR